MDHEAFLGPTLTHIAREKAAIIRTGAWVVTAPQKPEATRVLDQVIVEKRAHVFGPASVEGIPLGLEGSFQKVNAGLAVRAAGLLMQLCGGTLSKRAVERGLAGSDWAGRMERLEKSGVDYLLDGAHNPDATAALVRSLRQSDAGRPRMLIFGASRDKRTDEMLRELSRFFSEIILTPIRSARSSGTGLLAAQAAPFFKRIYLAMNLMQSLKLARSLAAEGSLVTITGSLYLAGEARRLLRSVHA